MTDSRAERKRSVRVDTGTGAFLAERTVRAMTLRWQALSVQRIARRSVQLNRGRRGVEKGMLESQQGTRSRGHHCILF